MGAGSPDSSEKFTKILGFTAILIWTPRKSQNYQASIQCYAIIGFANGLMMTAYIGICILPLKLKNIKKKKLKKKNIVKIAPPLTKLSGSAHETKPHICICQLFIVWNFHILKEVITMQCICHAIMCTVLHLFLIRNNHT